MQQAAPKQAWVGPTFRSFAAPFRPLLQALIIAMHSEIDKLIELLTGVAEEKLGCEIAEGLAEKISWIEIPEVGEVYSNLFHYWHDKDIREKDKEYKEMQESELSKLIQHLKNEEFGGACNISFLGAKPNSQQV